ncbi:hypothetical protein HPB51_017109 [Rhipicephalus microplus]|uniref:Uncharacterized protein n=1 Tax=Rhipicephalus microplus TaxID=6941 RepID=A0A9J6DIB3_RHIMP|nr:hypothetical protein HPB51_017109 [Rhipicephalus microplus]
MARRQRLGEYEEVVPQLLRVPVRARETKTPARTTASVDLPDRARINKICRKPNAAPLPVSTDPDFKRQRARCWPFVNAPSVTNNSASSALFVSADHGHHTQQRHHAKSYGLPFKAVKRCPKHFALLLNGREDSVSMDRIKPAFLDSDTVLEDY